MKSDSLTEIPRVQCEVASTPMVANQFATPVVDTRDLLGSRQAIDIEHNGQRYRLQTTKAGKLILTK